MQSWPPACPAFQKFGCTRKLLVAAFGMWMKGKSGGFWSHSTVVCAAAGRVVETARLSVASVSKHDVFMFLSNLGELEALVGAARKGPLRDPGAVGGRSLPDVHRQAALLVDEAHRAAPLVHQAPVLAGGVGIGLLCDVRAAARARYL